MFRTVAVCAVCVAGAAFAQGKSDNPVVQARMDLMQTQRQNIAVLGGMANGQAAFDAAAAGAARDALVVAAEEVVDKFKAEERDPNDRSLDDIWMAFDDFSAKAEALVVAATALDTGSLDTIRAGMGAVGGACQACHQSYQKPQ